MAKRCLLVLTLLYLCAFSAFSLDSGNTKNSLVPDFSMSAGGRIFYNGMFNIWERAAYSSISVPTIRPLEKNLYSNHGFGIGVFFDATYVEIGMDFIFGSFKSNAETYDGGLDMKSTQFGFSILAKYPFTLGPVMFFPLLGIDSTRFSSPARITVIPSNAMTSATTTTRMMPLASL